MQRIKLFSDSTCDLPQAEIAAMDVDIIPLLITIKDVEYLDGVTIDSNLLFQKVAETKSLLLPLCKPIMKHSSLM